MQIDRERIESDLLRSVERTGPWFYVVLVGLLSVSLWGLYAYCTQLVYGLGVTE
jgi:hypothetical protein